MAIAATPTERTTALMVFRLADAVTQFRRYVEVCYLEAQEELDSGAFGPIPVPEVVDIFFRLIREHIDLLTDRMTAVPEYPERAKQLVDAADRMRGVMEDNWLGEGHQERLRQRSINNRNTEYQSESACDWRMLDGSPFGPSAWAKYEAAVNCLAECFPFPDRPVFELARLLAAVNYHIPSDYDAKGGRCRAYDQNYLHATVSRRITDLMKTIRDGSRLLEGLPDRLGATDPRLAAVRLYEGIQSQLEAVGSDAESVESEEPSERVLESKASDEQLPRDISLHVVSLSPNEKFDHLLALKKRMDPQDDYIGTSLPILKLFQKIEDLNKFPNESVVIFGPSGSGKTHLAAIIHKNSQRTGKYISLSANQISGGDATILRVNLAGHGKNSGLAGIPGEQSKEGWLQQAEGGTIFIDELHDLDEQSCGYLRQVLDRSPIPLAMGEGDPFKPDVRLIFATFQPIQTLEQKLAVDFVRRLGKRSITVPSLRERKEDIPLFVEKFRDGRRLGECFYLGLLFHDWIEGQVFELREAIRTAAGRKLKGTKLLVSDLRSFVPDPVIERVTNMTEQEIGRQLYTFLIRVLEARGFLPRARGGNALNQQLAKILGISEPTLSNRLSVLGLKAGSLDGGDSES